MDLPVQNTGVMPDVSADLPPTHHDKPSSFLGIALLSALIASVMALFLFWQNQILHTRIALLQQPSPSPAVDSSPTASADPTANWKTYTNDDQKISFKYPPEWELTATEGSEVNGEVINQNVTLSRSPASISMNLNLSGIGGRGTDLNGEPYTVDGHNLYKYRSDMDNGNILIGITDDVTESLGVFQINSKTYSISLVYPKNINSNYEQDFDSILSSFKFSDTVK